MITFVTKVTGFFRMPHPGRNEPARLRRTAKKGKNKQKSAQAALLTGINLIGPADQDFHLNKGCFGRIFASIRHKNGPIRVRKAPNPPVTKKPQDSPEASENSTVYQPFCG